MNLEIAHYLPLLERKHRGLDRSVPVRRWLETAPTCWRRLLEELRRKKGEVDGSKEFVQALQLCQLHGIAATTRAVRRSLSSGFAGVATVRHYLGAAREEAQPPVPPLDYQGPEVRQGPLEAYMEVTCG